MTTRRTLAERAHLALAWACPLALGLFLAYSWSVAPGAVAGAATVTAAFAVAVTWVVLDYRYLQRRVALARRVVETLQSARLVLGLLEYYVRDRRALVAELMALHTPWREPAGAPRVHYLIGHRPPPEGHECVTELVWVWSLGWGRCDPEQGVHLMPACVVCDEEWPCATARLARPGLSSDPAAVAPEPPAPEPVVDTPLPDEQAPGDDVAPDVVDDDAAAVPVGGASS